VSAAIIVRVLSIIAVMMPPLFLLFQIRDVRVSLNQMYAREHDNAAQECTLQSAPHRRTAAGKLWALGEALKRRLSAFGGAKS
jgi:hypothetical protein